MFGWAGQSSTNFIYIIGHIIVMIELIAMVSVCAIDIPLTCYQILRLGLNTYCTPTSSIVETILENIIARSLMAVWKKYYASYIRLMPAHIYYVFDFVFRFKLQLLNVLEPIEILNWLCRDVIFPEMEPKVSSRRYKYR